MRFFVYTLLSALLPLFTSAFLYRNKKCSLWTVVVSPLAGCFVFMLSILILFLVSGDM